MKINYELEALKCEINQLRERLNSVSVDKNISEDVLKVGTTILDDINKVIDDMLDNCDHKQNVSNLNEKLTELSSHWLTNMGTYYIGDLNQYFKNQNKIDVCLKLLGIIINKYKDVD